MFYSPVLKIAYDGIFRLRDIEAKDSLLLTFEKELGGNCMLLDRGRTQSHEVRHSEDMYSIEEKIEYYTLHLPRLIYS